MTISNEQEMFWVGDFGNDYILRNKPKEINHHLNFFSRIKIHGIDSVIEFGSNIGVNLQALKQLYPSIQCSAVEINAQAVTELRKHPWITVHHQSIHTYLPTEMYDLVLVKGLLIHIHPQALASVYATLYQSAKRYILLCEYYNPTPVAIEYRGHRNKLFKRDFCGELLDRYPDLTLLDYGFCYHRDPVAPQDDLTWFLLEKNTCEKM